MMGHCRKPGDLKQQQEIQRCYITELCDTNHPLWSTHSWLVSHVWATVHPIKWRTDKWRGLKVSCYSKQVCSSLCFHTQTLTVTHSHTHTHVKDTKCISPQAQALLYCNASEFCTITHTHTHTHTSFIRYLSIISIHENCTSQAPIYSTPSAELPLLLVHSRCSL